MTHILPPSLSSSYSALPLLCSALLYLTLLLRLLTIRETAMPSNNRLPVTPSDAHAHVDVDADLARVWQSH